MVNQSDESTAPAGDTVFVTSEYFLVGVGESVADVERTGEWVATSDPVEVRR